MFQIDSQSRVPVYEQIVSHIERYVLIRLFVAGQQLPSIRSLSMQLHLNPNTVQRAYGELDKSGIIYTITGVGAFISEDALQVLQSKHQQRLSQLRPVIQELALAGVEKEAVVELVNSVYEEGTA